MKKCNKCSLDKELSEFYKRKNGYYHSECKECHKKAQKLRPYNKDKQREYRIRYELKTGKTRSKKRYKLNKEQIRERTLISYWSLPSQYRQYIKSAKKRNLEFSLTKEDCTDFFNSTCYYCEDFYKGLGIDRIDNNLGYIKQNCVSCCSTCNFMKHKMSLDQFKEKIIKINKKIMNGEI